jgi:hypothetical protein
MGGTRGRAGPTGPWRAVVSLHLPAPYWIGSTIEDYPLASVVISGVVTTAIMGLVHVHVRRRRRAAALRADAPAAGVT